jgi:hypothetical protein
MNECRNIFGTAEYDFSFPALRDQQAGGGDNMKV